MNTKSVTKTEGLPPCPFCGSEDYYITLTDNPFSYDTYSTAHCSKCHATGPFVAESYLEDEPKPARDYMETVAKEKWQTRPIEDELRARIAELEEAQRWIPVTEGLPEFGTSILFYDSILERTNKGTCTALNRDKTNLQWLTDDGIYYHGNRCEYITHWKEEPELPEVQE
jgi:hypothetical protein